MLQLRTIRSGSADLKAEFSAVWRLGLPMGLTQLVQFSIQTVDALMLGRLGPEALAAASIGLAVYFITFLFGIGPAIAISPLVSQALGAKADDHLDARLSVRMGIWIAAFCFPLLTPVLLFSEPIIVALGQPADLVALAKPYMAALAPGLPCAIGVIMLRNFLATIELTRAPLFIIIATTAFNAGVNYLLIYGSFGAPRLELVGAGIASSLSHMLGFGLLALYAQREKTARAFEIFRDFFKPDWARFRTILRLGLPIGVATGFEALLFNSGVFLMGAIGVLELAAYQVALNVAALAFMMPLGVSMAGAVRVGLAAGAGDRPRVRRAAIATAALSIFLILIVAAPAALAPEFIISAYFARDDAANAEVVSLATAFLRIAAAFMIFDAAQVAANQALRGLKDVRVPMLLAGFSYWLVGFPIAYFAGLHSSAGAVGVWWGLLAALACAAALLGARLWALTRGG